MSAYRWHTLTEKLLPWWLKTGEGGLVKAVLDLMLGAVSERARQGLLTRGPETCATDALAYHGRDRGIVRGINEPDDAYRARLIRYLDDHLTQGSPFALHDQLRAYMQADVRVRTVDRAGNWYTTDAGGARSVVRGVAWDWDGMAATAWSRFWVIIYPVAGLPWAASDGSGSWPSGGTIGTTATPDQVATVRAIIRTWQPDGTRCEWILVAYDAATFDPAGAPEPDGAWRYFGRDDGGGGYIPARVESARCWRGVDGQ